MALKKLSPRKFTQQQEQAIQSQAAVQEISKAAPKSLDPVNFPVFEVPVNKKVLVYVPNHTIVDVNGVVQLRMDKPLVHSVQDGRRFLYYRCIANLDANTGYSGNCPLCEGTAEPWDLANEIIKQKCEASGLSTDDTENTSVKQIRSDAYGDRVIKEANRYFTFPIVVFETLGDDGKTFVYDEENNLKFRIMWYNISETQYEDKWKKCFEGMDDEPTHPGGHFFLLNYCYTPKRGEPNKRDSARNLVVSSKRVKDSENLRNELDRRTEEWTPLKAQQTVCNNVFYAEEDLQYVADEVLQNTRSLLSLYKNREVTGASNVDTSGFTLTKKPDDDTNGSTEIPPEMDTDLDME